MVITSPCSAAEWAAYYQLRYEVLRQPWHQPRGSERADDDDVPTTTHALLLAPEGYAIAVGRLHPSGEAQGQLRFMAVHPLWQGKGAGRQLLEHLEEQARQQGLVEITLHAREQAVPFYQRLGYQVIAPSHTLFGTIPHFLMQRAL